MNANKLADTKPVVRKGPLLRDINPTAEELAEYAELEAWAERSVKSTAKLVLGEPSERKYKTPV